MIINTVSSNGIPQLDALYVERDGSAVFSSKLSPGDVFHDRMIRVIKCPSDCTEVTAILLQDATGDLIGEFTLCDANGDTTAGIGNVWAAGHYIQVLFDKTSGCAQVLNGANSRAVHDRISYGTADMTAGTSELATGMIYLVYE